jgi:hypothetical protein
MPETKTRRASDSDSSQKPNILPGREGHVGATAKNNRLFVEDGEDQAIGRSKGGLSTKIHLTVDALGNPLAFFLTGGQVHDLAGADVLLPQMKADTVLADKAFDADARVIEPLLAAGKTPIIPPKSSRKTPRFRPGDVQGTPSHREFRLQAQAIPSHSDPL